MIVAFFTAVISASCDNKTESPEPETAILPGPEKFSIAMNGQSIEIAWEGVAGAASYDIFRAGSRLSEYTFLKNVKETLYTDLSPNPVKYENYYLVTAKNKTGKIQDIIVSFELKMFGGNMKFYDIKYDNISKIKEEVNRIHDREMFGNAMDNNARTGEFSSKRYALYFKPGEYRDFERFKIGFYTHVAGLGRVPEETKLFGSIETPPHLQNNNATCTFWRSIENFEISGYGVFRWGVSQAAPVRRMKINVPAAFDWLNGWASGGYSGDCYFADTSGSWSQQQWYSRNSHHSSGLFGISWNKFVQGATGNIANDNWTEGGSVTRIETTPVIREKPFLYLENGEYKVFVPALRREAVGVSWTAQDMGSGYSLDIEKDFYIAIAGIDTSDTINAALENGKHIFFTPGIYELSSPIRIKRAGTIILGTGFATLVPGPENIFGAMFIYDVGNVTVAGLLFDAHYSSAYLLCAGGATDADSDHSSSPTLLADIFLRVGGYKHENVHVDVAALINSNDIIGDHFWVWRGDHGRGIGWDKNTTKNGLVVTGDNVTFYGLFVEHFHEYQTLWIGDNGRTYFYQSESPYDPFSQDVYLSQNGTVDGWASYKVANSVTSHFAAGLGVYAVFNRTGHARDKSEPVFMENAIEVPDKPDVIIKHACIIDLSGDHGVATGIRSVVNGAGPGVRAGTGGQNAKREYLLSYSNGIAQTYSGRKTGIKNNDEFFIILSNLLP
ncbi:MAG: hypothetical protein LBQ93_11510 [Treponema sp.]|nr:hypothetical protein [Treponema sp.]